MGTVAALLKPKPRDIGDFMVTRALPSIDHPMVGPFIFWDEMGPANFAPGKGLDVRPHPHIGLATITYLFDGEIDHRDTLGVHQTIRPGDVNIMCAGRGIAHSERTGPQARAAGHCLHGIQAWIALPEDQEERDPMFEHRDGRELPRLERDGADVTLIAGTAFGLTAPTAVFSPTLYLDVRLAPGGRLDLPEEHEARAFYVVEGAVRVAGTPVPAQGMAILEAGPAAIENGDGPARVMVLGGAPLGKRFISWNFVSSRQERIEQARADWRASAAGGFKDTPFAMPPTEHEHIPLPGDPVGPPENTEDCPTS